MKVAATASAYPQDSSSAAPKLSGFHRYLQIAKAANAQRFKSEITEKALAERHRELRARMALMSAERHGALDSHLASLLASAPPAMDDGK